MSFGYSGKRLGLVVTSENVPSSAYPSEDSNQIERMASKLHPSSYGANRLLQRSRYYGFSGTLTE